MPSLKEDASFIEFLALGATATERAIEFLNNKDHNVIELERGALSSKLWENKEKALRVPDLLCLNCGRTIESRGKKNLEIKMSHSTSKEDREWDYDADDEDWVALVKCTKDGERPRDWEAPEVVNIVSYDKLRDTVDMTKQERGGPTQGSELTIEWPSSTASADGIVKQITDEDRIQISRDSDGYTLSYNLDKKIDDDEYITMKPLVEQGEFVKGESQFIAAPFELVNEPELNCSNDFEVKDFVKNIDSDSFSDRFAAIKALGYLHSEEGISKLEEVTSDDELNPFVRLEAAASLAKQNQESGWEYLQDILESADEEMANQRLEVAIILGEIDSQKSTEILSSILIDGSELEEIRAEAAHSIGLLKATESLDELIQSFELESNLIRRNAVEAAAKIITGSEDSLIEGLNATNNDRQLGCALAVAEAGTDVTATVLQEAENLPRDGIAIALSLMDESEIDSILEERDLDQEIIFAATTMSSFFNSWADLLSEDLRYELRNEIEEDEETRQATLEATQD
jgi:HEAT repeat protein